MENFISAIKSNDLVQAKKAFNAIMLERTADLIEERKKHIAASVMIEGEEPEDDEDAPKKGSKSDDDADEGDEGDEDEDDD